MLCSSVHCNKVQLICYQWVIWSPFRKIVQCMMHNLQCTRSTRCARFIRYTRCTRPVKAGLFYKHLRRSLNQSVTHPFPQIFIMSSLQTVRARELKIGENVHRPPFVTCHMLPVICQWKWWSLLVEGLLPTGPTLCSFFSILPLFWNWNCYLCYPSKSVSGTSTIVIVMSCEVSQEQLEVSHTLLMLTLITKGR